MGRLIDDEQFITEMEINIGNIYNPDVIKGMRFGIDLINSRPTAYDVEAVVKELEELKQIEMNDECPMDDICGDCECSKHKCKGCYTSKAIEIVKEEGGIE